MSDILHLPTRSFGVPMLFSALDTPVQERLRTASPLLRYSDGQLVQHRGDPADGFWLVEEGSVAAGQFLPDGEFRALALLGPGDSLGELALFAGRPRVVDVIARGSSRLRLIRSTAFEAALADDPGQMRKLLGAMSAQVQELLDVIAGIRRGTATARVAGMLANLAGERNAPARIAITQQELGELLGLTRATVNAALRELEQGGLLSRSYGRIAVPDPARLALAAHA